MGPEYEHLKDPLADSNMQPAWSADSCHAAPQSPCPWALPCLLQEHLLLVFPTRGLVLISLPFSFAWLILFSPFVPPLLTFQVSVGFKIQIGVISSKKTSLIIDYTICPALCPFAYHSTFTLVPSLRATSMSSLIFVCREPCLLPDNVVGWMDDWVTWQSPDSNPVF